MFENFNYLGKLILISSGGVFDAKDVLDRIKNGANLVQIYSSFLLNVISL